MTTEEARIIAETEARIGKPTGFVNWRYDPEDRDLLFRWMNTFVRRAFGFQTKWFFIGFLVVHENPPHVIDLEYSDHRKDQTNAG